MQDIQTPRIFQIRKTQVSASLVAILALTLTVLGVGCSNDKTTQLSRPGASLAKANANAVSEGTEPTCTTEDISGFNKQSGQVFDLEREKLPKGLFLASAAELLIEKKQDTQVVARVLVHETIGGKESEIRCSESLERFGQDFDMTMTGLVKFESADVGGPTSKFVQRQFFFFKNRTGYGAVVSNPKTPLTTGDLQKAILSTGAQAQLIRFGDRDFAIRYVREREGGVKAILMVKLELI